METKKSILKDKSYKFALDVMLLVDKIKDRNISANVVIGQLIRSATSIGANIIEAQAGSSKKDFTNFFAHSLKSAYETVYWLRLLKTYKQINEVEALINECEELIKLLTKSIKTLKEIQ